MVVGEAEPSVSVLFSKDTVLFDELINGPLPVLLQPTCDASKGEQNGVRFADTCELTSGRKTPKFSYACNMFEFPYLQVHICSAQGRNTKLPA